MRLGWHDRKNAIQRCPAYIEEQNQIKDLFQKKYAARDRKKAAEILFEEAVRKSCRKWNIKVPFFPTEDGELSKRIDMLHERTAIDEWSEDDLPCNALSYIPTLGTSAANVRVDDYVYTRLRIDLTKTEGELKKAFIEKIRSWKTHPLSLLGPEDRKPRKTNYDPWECYDLHQKGMSLNEIARKLAGGVYPKGKKSPAYNEKLWSPYKNVKRAYERALKMIQFVERKYNPSKKSSRPG